MTIMTKQQIAISPIPDQEWASRRFVLDIA